MPSASRQGDKDTGHPGRPPTASLEGSPSVVINGRAALRQGDPLAGHGCTSGPRHVAYGSPSVFIDGRPAARVGDAIDCGGEMADGSDNVVLDGRG